MRSTTISRRQCTTSRRLRRPPHLPRNDHCRRKHEGPPDDGGPSHVRTASAIQLASGWRSPYDEREFCDRRENIVRQSASTKFRDHPCPDDHTSSRSSEESSSLPRRNRPLLHMASLAVSRRKKIKRNIFISPSRGWNETIELQDFRNHHFELCFEFVQSSGFGDQSIEVLTFRHPNFGLTIKFCANDVSHFHSHTPVQMVLRMRQSSWCSHGNRRVRRWSSRKHDCAIFHYEHRQSCTEACSPITPH